MTKWARMRKRKERRRMEEASVNYAPEENEVKLAEPKKVFDTAKRFLI